MKYANKIKIGAFAAALAFAPLSAAIAAQNNSWNSVPGPNTGSSIINQDVRGAMTTTPGLNSTPGLTTGTGTLNNNHNVNSVNYNNNNLRNTGYGTSNTGVGSTQNPLDDNWMQNNLNTRAIGNTAPVPNTTPGYTQPGNYVNDPATGILNNDPTRNVHQGAPTNTQRQGTTDF